MVTLADDEDSYKLTSVLMATFAVEECQIAMAQRITYHRSVDYHTHYNLLMEQY